MRPSNITPILPHAILGMVLTLSHVLAAQSRPEIPAPDMDGNYRWEYVDSGGIRREFVFEPATKVLPSVAVRVDRNAADGYEYAYSVSNGPSAQQKIFRVTVEVTAPATLLPAPTGWQKFAPASVAPRAAWFKLNESGEFDGIAAGSQEVFHLQSPNLPGVTDMLFRGSVNESIGPPGDAPAEIADQIDSQLDALRGREIIARRTLGPVLRPDTSSTLLLQRIVRNYRNSLLASDLPNKKIIVQRLDQALVIVEDTKQARESLRTLTSELSVIDTDGWSAELKLGLGLCLSHWLASAQ